VDRNTLIIGLTGSFGSGCTESAKYLEGKGFLRFSLSDIIRNEAKERKLSSPTRKDMQDIGDELRKDNGHKYLMAETLKKINKTSKPVVIDSIRNHSEVYYLRRQLSNSYLFNIDAEKDIRYKRVKNKYSSKEAFEEDDERDSGEDQPEYGQQVRKCVDLADVVINNNTSLEDLQHKLDKYLKLIEKPRRYRPSKQELGMAHASRESRNSLCLKRQVGAVIMRERSIISRGYNDVPNGVLPCRDMGQCNRDYYRECPHCGEPIAPTISKCSNCDQPIPKDWRKMIRKYLDLCRALHAEQRAILQSAKKKISLKGTTLYVTTYPCLMCAKGIIEVGIKRVIYVDPYPYEDTAKMFIQAGVTADKFEGVVERALARLYKTKVR